MIYLSSGRAVSCPFPRSIFMIKVFVWPRVHVLAHAGLCVRDRVLEFININPKLVSVTRETTYGRDVKFISASRMYQ